MRHLAIAIIIALSSFTALTGSAQAQDAAIAPLPLQVWLRREAAPFVEPRYTAMITAGKDKFAFLVPDGYFVRGDPSSGTFTLANAEGNSSITFAVLPPLSSDAPPFGPDTCRNWVLRDYMGGKIIKEFSTSAAGGKGPGFDIQWKTSSGFIQCKRVLFVSSSAGILKFTATSNSNHFDSANSVLNSIVLSLRFSTDGVLKVPPVPADS
jgi:hypothetical protein